MSDSARACTILRLIFELRRKNNIRCRRRAISFRNLFINVLKTESPFGGQCSNVRIYPKRSWTRRVRPRDIRDESSSLLRGNPTTLCGPDPSSDEGLKSWLVENRRYETGTRASTPKHVRYHATLSTRGRTR